MALRTLLIGDIVGGPGRNAVQALLPRIVRTERIDLVIANSENAAGGSGITPAAYQTIRDAGADVLTMGDHCFRKKESLPLYESHNRLLRPANLPEAAVGRGWTVVETRNGVPVAVILLQGRTFLRPIDCPFAAVERALRDIGGKTRLIFVDVHAEATSDKVAMGWHLDGRVTSVTGTHTHVQTADERILPKGTAYISDLGMTGPYDGVLGRKRDRVLKSLITGMPTYFEVASGDIHLCGAIVTADPDTGRASAIERVNLAYNPGAADAQNATRATAEGDS